MLRRIFVAFVVLLALAGVGPAAWAEKVGPEFRINTHAIGQKERPSVARLSDGGFVVAWQTSAYQNLAQDGSKYGVYGQRYSAAGAAAGGEFRVNTYTLNDQSDPSVAALSGGGFVVTWTSFATAAAGQDGSRSGVYGQLYNAAGAPVGGEFRVNTYTNLDQAFSSVAGLSGGGFVVTWQSDVKDGSSYGVFAKRYSATGAPAGGEFRVNTHVTFAQARPSIASLSNGGFVVTWQSAGQDNSGWGVYGQRYNATGVRVGGEFRVNTQAALDQWNPSVAGLSDGGFVVTWHSFGQDGALNGVYGQRYSATGAPAGAEFRVNTVTSGNQDFPSVAGLSDGGFIVTFQSNNSGGGIYGQRYSAAGAPVGAEFQVNTTAAGTARRFPSVARLNNGGFVVTWDTTHAVYGQRFADLAPKITLNPVSQTVASGQTVTFTADASGSPTPTVQWQSRRSGEINFVDITGATAKTLTFTTTLKQSGNQYRAVFSNSLGKAATNAATLTVTFF